MIALFFKLFIQLFFLLTPFFALTMFLSLAEGMSRKAQILLIIKTTIAIFVICYVLVFAGRIIFDVFGITVDAFRIGAGAVLFLSAVDLVKGQATASKADEVDDIAVVPLAIPIIVGPATIGTLMVMGSETDSIRTMITLCFAIAAAILFLSFLLMSSPWIMKVLGKKGLVILSRLTGLILAALSAQMIFTGVAAFLIPSGT